MNELPEQWSSEELQNLIGAHGLISDGDWIESKDQDPDGEVRLIQLMDIGDGTFLNKSSRFLTSGAAERLRCTFLQPGDVLVARMPDPLGRACIFPGVGQPAVTAVDVLIWRPGAEGVSSEWVMTAINSPEIRARIAAEAGGTTRQRISGGRLKSMSVPVPPLPEQRRIVAKLDRLAARSAAARDHLARTVKLAARAKQAVMAKVFQEQVGDCEVSELGAIASHVTSGSRDWARYYDQGEAVFVLAGNVRPMAFDAIPKRFVDPPRDAADARRTRIQKDDLLVTIVGANTGDLCRVDQDLEDYFVCQSVALVRLAEPWRARFVELFLNSEMTNGGQMQEAIYGQGRPHLSFVDLKGFLIPLPDQPATEKIVRRIEAAFARIDRLTEEASRAAHLLDRLDERLLAKAFRGEIVPQNPADEPASILLDRIRAARAAAPRRKGDRPRASMLND